MCPALWQELLSTKSSNFQANAISLNKSKNEVVRAVVVGGGAVLFGAGGAGLRAEDRLRAEGGDVREGGQGRQHADHALHRHPGGRNQVRLQPRPQRAVQVPDRRRTGETYTGIQYTVHNFSPFSIPRTSDTVVQLVQYCSMFTKQYSAFFEQHNLFK